MYGVCVAPDITTDVSDIVFVETLLQRRFLEVYKVCCQEYSVLAAQHFSCVSCARFVQFVDDLNLYVILGALRSCHKPTFVVRRIALAAVTRHELSDAMELCSINEYALPAGS